MWDLFNLPNVVHELTSDRQISCCLLLRSIAMSVLWWTHRTRASRWHSPLAYSNSYAIYLLAREPSNIIVQDILPREEGLLKRELGQAAIRSDGVL